ncbi:MAG: hypothetical protein RIS94_2687 [Pseudomonadota bacterium]|jgi:TetR/AcrR family tetracycline transcriptional repressor
MARQRDTALGRDAILRAAFDLLDEAGLEGITMRALAARLGVQAPALYWHVKDKGALIALMAQEIYGEARHAQEGSATARDWLMRLGLGLRDALAGHRDAARLLATASPLAQPDEPAAEAMAAPLVMLGFNREDALEAQAAVLSLTLGWALYRENAAMADFLSGLFDLKRSYEKGLALLVGGLVAEAATAG